MKKTFLLVYFFLLAICLFLGDGKQPLVDVFFSGCAIALFFLHRYSKIPMAIPDRRLRILFGLTIVGSIFSLFFSQSIGLSVYALMRLFFALEIFYLFFTISSEVVVRLYSRLLVSYVFLAIIISIIVSNAATFTSWIPRMNLLVTNYGHNHLADLLLFAIPLVSGASFIVLLVVLFFTFARGAWLPVSLNFLDRKLIILPAVFVTVVLLFYYKPSGLFDQRINYWQQAWQTIKEKPFFGNGPGTFSLVSRRLQQTTNAYSWYTHNFVLQTTVESGLVGSVPLFLLILYVLYKAWIQKKHTGIFLGLLGTILYSFYEFNLDFLVIWLLFWSGAGVLLGIDKEKINNNLLIEQRVVMMGIVVFYITNVLSLATSAWPRISFYIAPYVEVNALSYIESTGAGLLSPLDKKVIAFFHKKSYSVLYALGDFEQAVSAFPKDDQYQRAYLAMVLKNNNSDEVISFFEKTCRRVSQAGTDYCALPESFPKQKIFDAFVGVQEGARGGSFAQEFQKMVYLTGLYFVETDPRITKYFWEMARVIEPSWGYYHVDLAALEHYIIHDDNASRGALSFCQQFFYTKKWCRELSRDLDTLPPVGAVEDNIRAIPKIL